MNNKLVVVLGMHRSGTSIITRGLKILGVDLGENLMPAHDGNPRGYFEDVDINSLNIRIQKSINSNWDYLTCINERQVNECVKNGYLEEAYDLLKGKIASFKYFGVKDPRISVLLPFWKKVFEKIGYEICYVIAIRNPIAVARSLKSRDNLSEVHGYFLWLSHILTSLLESTNANRIVVDYDRVLESPVEEWKRISEKFQMPINHRELSLYQSDFLDSNLRHTHNSLGDLAKDPGIPSLVSAIYQDLLNAATNNEDLNSSHFLEKTMLWKNRYSELELLLNLSNEYYEKKNYLDIVNIYLRRREKKLLMLATRRKQLLSLGKSRMAENTEEIDQLRKTILVMKNSKSWRLTDPLRKARNFFQKLCF